MPLLVTAVILLVLALGLLPSVWVQAVMARYGRERPDFPGTGGELARHLLHEGTHDPAAEAHEERRVEQDQHEMRVGKPGRVHRREQRQGDDDRREHPHQHHEERARGQQPTAPARIDPARERAEQRQ